jgi:hypothetical protein
MAAWLSLTPEPERHLPQLLALLARDAAPSGRRLRAEQTAMTRLVLRGTPRRWRRYLDQATSQAVAVAHGASDGDPHTTELALAVVEIVLEHDRMLIGLPGRAYRRTAGRRRLLRQAQQTLRERAGVQA